MPERLTIMCVDGLQRLCIVSKEDQSARGTHGAAGRVRGANLRIFPRKIPRPQIKSQQTLTRVLARNVFHSSRVKLFSWGETLRLLSRVICLALLERHKIIKLT